MRSLRERMLVLLAATTLMIPAFAVGSTGSVLAATRPLNTGLRCPTLESIAGAPGHGPFAGSYSEALSWGWGGTPFSYPFEIPDNPPPASPQLAGIKVLRSRTTPHNGFIELEVTVGGRPVTGYLELRAVVDSPGGVTVDSNRIGISQGRAYYGYCFPEDLIGQSVTVTFGIVPDEFFAASTASPRTFTLVDLPQPVIAVEAPAVAPSTGRFGVTGSVKDLPFPDVLGVQVAISRQADGFPLADDQVGLVGGAGTVPYDLRASAGKDIRIDVGLVGDTFVGDALPVSRRVTLSRGNLIGYTLPRVAKLTSSGVLVVGSNPLAPGAQAFSLNILIDGRLHVFPGRFELGRKESRSGPTGPGIHFDYSLPPSAVGKKALISVSNPISATFAASSSSPRTVEIVK